MTVLPSAIGRNWSGPAAGLRWSVCGLLVVALSGPAGAETPSLASLLEPLGLHAYRPGTKPPAFSGLTLEARRLSIGELRGKVIVLNFWASWCVECRRELPALDRVHRDFEPRGLAVIGINAREDGERLRRFAHELRLTFPLVPDPDGKINAAYGVVALPTTFVVGRDGRAIALAVGPREWGSAPAVALIRALLDEPGTS